MDEGGEGAEPEQFVFVAAQKNNGENGCIGTSGKNREAVRVEG